MRQLTHTWSSGLSNNQRDREGKVECQDPPGMASDERNEFPIALLREKGKRRRLSVKWEEAGGYSLGV